MQMHLMQVRLVKSMLSQVRVRILYVRLEDVMWHCKMAGCEILGDNLCEGNLMKLSLAGFGFCHLYHLLQFHSVSMPQPWNLHEMLHQFIESSVHLLIVLNCKTNPFRWKRADIQCIFTRASGVRFRVCV